MNDFDRLFREMCYPGTSMSDAALMLLHFLEDVEAVQPEAWPWVLDGLRRYVVDRCSRENEDRRQWAARAAEREAEAAAAREQYHQQQQQRVKRVPRKTRTRDAPPGLDTPPPTTSVLRARSVSGLSGPCSSIIPSRSSSKTARRTLWDAAAECVECGVEVIAGFGQSPYEHWLQLCAARRLAPVSGVVVRCVELERCVNRV